MYDRQVVPIRIPDNQDDVDDAATTFLNNISYTIGQWARVRYNNNGYAGEILHVVGNDVQVNVMATSHLLQKVMF